MIKYIMAAYTMSVFTIVTILVYGPVIAFILLGRLGLYKRSTHGVHQCAIKWGQWIFKCMPGWTLDISGSEHLPKKDEPMVIVSNHESATDILILYYLAIQFRWIAKDSIFKIPLVGRAMKGAGYVSISRGDRDSHKKALARCGRWLDDNVPVLFFPQGTRSETGEIKNFKVGAFKLAHEHKVEVLPVLLTGAGELLRKHSFVPGKAHVRVHVLKSEPMKEGETVSEFTSRIEKLMALAHQEKFGVKVQQAEDISSSLNKSPLPSSSS